MPAKLVCLLPARNAAADLPGFFESASRFADAVVALDDGSTDDTHDLLRSEPLVVRVISNPRRADYRGWNDAANRNLLLEAASDLEPDWIISIDSDERLPDDDALALRKFLDSDALPGIAYGFRCYSMVGDLAHTLPHPIWVYRLFAFQAGVRFPDQALHFAPIPTTIPRQAFLRSTFRIQHLGGMSPERRLARYEKYRQADPECRFWPDYTTLLNEPPPESVQNWKPRAPGTPVLYATELDPETETAIETGDGPWLAVIVIDDGPLHGIMRALDSIPVPDDAETLEVLLVTSRRDRVNVRPHVTSVECKPDATPGTMRNAGLAATTAKHVLFLDAERSLLPGALEAIAGAHRIGYALVTGAVEPDVNGAREWARFTYRFGSDRRRRSNAILDGSPRWASYNRQLLLEHAGFSELLPSGEEIVIARTLATRGYLTRSIGTPLITYHGSESGSMASDGLDAFRRGVAHACFFLNEYADRGELLNRRFLSEQLVRQLPRRLSRVITRTKAQAPSSKGKTATIAAVHEIAQWLGQWAELLRPKHDKALTLIGRPGGLALTVLRRSQGLSIVLVRFDLREPSLRIAVVPVDLMIPTASGVWTSLKEAIVETGMLSRFAAQDLIGRPFQLDLDDLIWLNEDALPENARTEIAKSSLPGEELGLVLNRLTPQSCWALWSAFLRGQGAETTLSMRAVWLALLRLRAIQPANVDILTLPGAGVNLDAEIVEMAQSFLDAGSIRRPATRRNRLRQVEWA